jgi:asparagine synthase (glutamine-hydrolysing)
MIATPLEGKFGALAPAEASLRNSLYASDFMAALGDYGPRSRFYEDLTASRGFPWADRVMDLNVRTLLPDDFLAKVDLATMAVSLEARCPFLDLDVMSAAMRIPAATRFHGRAPKGLLRSLARRHIPAAGVDRRKQGFTAPINLWFRGSWRDLIDDTVLGGHVERRGWFRRPALERIVQEQRCGANHGSLLWGLLVLELWMRLVVDRTLAVEDVI